MAEAAVVAAITSSAYTIRESRQQEKEMRQRDRLAKRAAAIQRQRQRQQALAEASSQRAALQAEAASKGVGGASAVEQGLGVIKTQESSAAGFGLVMEGLGSEIAQADANIASSQRRVSQVQALGSIVQSGASLYKPKPATPGATQTTTS